jgi:hypothetical protein
MDSLESIALIVVLMALGVSAALATFIGALYYMEVFE